MPRMQQIEIEGLFAQAMHDRMKEIGMDLRTLSAETEASYEHLRKCSVGLAIPSDLMLRAICSALKLNLGEMKRLVVADRIRAEYGTIPEELAGKDPSMSRMERLWKQLAQFEKRGLEAQAEAIIRARKSAKMAD